MRLFNNFLLYLLIGLALYFLVSLLCKKKLLILFPIFFFLAVILAVISNSLTLAYTFAPNMPKLPAILSGILQWAGRLTLLFTGYCLGYVIQGLGRSASAPDLAERRKYIPYLIRGLSIPLGIVFIVTMIEQFHDIVAIRKFFLDAGYSVPFAYFITVLEGLCGLLFLLALPFYPKLSVIIVLFCVMLGAAITHFTKGDPFNSAIAAIQYDIKLGILLFVYLVASHGRGGHSDQLRRRASQK